MTGPDTQAPETQRVDLPIQGMTCASCVGRVQKALTRTDGVVTAAVNLAHALQSRPRD